jgi:hypothetical protein
MFVLNRPSGDEKNLQQPYDMSKFDSVDADDSEPTDDDKPAVKDPAVPQEADYRSKAIELVQSMVRTSRENGNRDKAFCRRLTGDAWLRLGMPDEAKTEFAQMKVVASQTRRNTAYYRIEPLSAEYWKHRIAGDDTAATKLLGDAKALAGGIPKSGGVALESAIALAAMLVDSDDVAGATSLLTSLQRDKSVSSQIDAVRHAAWVSTASALSDAGQSDNPYESPRNLEVSGQATYRKPRPLAMFGIVVLSVIAAGCTFFGTCVGIGLGLYSAGADEGLFLVCAYGGGTVLGVLIGLAVYRLMTRRKLYRQRSSAEESPQP